MFDTEQFYNILESNFIKDVLNQENLELKQFLYFDTIDFLDWCAGAGHNCYLVTFGDRSVQESKFLACGIVDYFVQTFYVEQGKKVDFIKSVKKVSST